jgi:hypothetical protein
MRPEPERVLTDAEHSTHTQELLTHAARRAQDNPAYVAYIVEFIPIRALVAMGSDAREYCAAHSQLP